MSRASRSCRQFACSFITVSPPSWNVTVGVGFWFRVQSALARLERGAPATGLLPVDEQEAPGGVERGSIGRRGDLKLELLDRPVGAVPAIQRPVTSPASTREQHDVNHGVVRNELVVLVQVCERPQRERALDRWYQGRVHPRGTVIEEAHDHTAEPRIEWDVLRLHAV